MTGHRGLLQSPAALQGGGGKAGTALAEGSCVVPRDWLRCCHDLVLRLRSLGWWLQGKLSLDAYDLMDPTLLEVSETDRDTLWSPMVPSSRILEKSASLPTSNHSLFAKALSAYAPIPELLVMCFLLFSCLAL